MIGYKLTKKQFKTFKILEEIIEDQKKNYNKKETSFIENIFPKKIFKDIDYLICLDKIKEEK